jgi:hypothetical protein
MIIRKLLRVIAITMIATACVFALPQSLTKFAPSNSASKLSDLSWIAGAWQTATGGRAQIEEYWMPPAGGSMLGISRTVAGEKTVEYEYLRIEKRGEDIFYVASPGARCPATDFKLTRVSNQEAVFENPQHDFPKRIIYRKGSDGSLTASIDAGEGTKSKSFAYVRAVK